MDMLQENQQQPLPEQAADEVMEDERSDRIQAGSRSLGQLQTAHPAQRLAGDVTSQIQTREILDLNQDGTSPAENIPGHTPAGETQGASAMGHQTHADEDAEADSDSDDESYDDGYDRDEWWSPDGQIVRIGDFSVQEVMDWEAEKNAIAADAVQAAEDEARAAEEAAQEAEAKKAQLKEVKKRPQMAPIMSSSGRPMRKCISTFGAAYRARNGRPDPEYHDYENDGYDLDDVVMQEEVKDEWEFKKAPAVAASSAAAGFAAGGSAAATAAVVAATPSAAATSVTVCAAAATATITAAAAATAAAAVTAAFVASVDGKKAAEEPASANKDEGVPAADEPGEEGQDRQDVWRGLAGEPADLDMDVEDRQVRFCNSGSKHIIWGIFRQKLPPLARHNKKSLR